MNRHSPDLAQKGFTRSHDERRNQHHEHSRRRCGTGRHRCAGEDLLEERRQPEDGRGQGIDAAKAGKTKPAAKKNARASKKGPKAGKASTPRAESKGAKILELIGRPKGASLAEIMKGTSWQAHSERGFLSTAAKKHGLKIESTKTDAGDRVYQIQK